MSIKRYGGTSFAEINSRKRWNGSSWVDLTVGKRWNGSDWVNLWSNSQGSGSEISGTSGSGVLRNGRSTVFASTVSRPTVNYSGEYTYQRTGNTLTVPVTFSAWISSASKLGLNIRLTVFARLNGGTWSSAVIKNDSAMWQNSSQRHEALIRLSGTVRTSNVIEWYVTRAGSSYSGTAGSLGSAKRPKKHTFSL